MHCYCRDRATQAIVLLVDMSNKVAITSCQIWIVWKKIKRISMKVSQVLLCSGWFVRIFVLVIQRWFKMISRTSNIKFYNTLAIFIPKHHLVFHDPLIPKVFLLVRSSYFTFEAWPFFWFSAVNEATWPQFDLGFLTFFLYLNCGNISVHHY